MMQKMLVLISAVIFSPALMAADATSVMAGIVADINHFPSADDKEALAQIAAGDASAHEKTLAGIISRIAHKPGDADKAELEKILAASDSVRKSTDGISHTALVDAMKGICEHTVEETPVS